LICKIQNSPVKHSVFDFIIFNKNLKIKNYCEKINSMVVVLFINSYGCLGHSIRKLILAVIVVVNLHFCKYKEEKLKKVPLIYVSIHLF
jgi:hypothetical protein